MTPKGFAKTEPPSMDAHIEGRSTFSAIICSALFPIALNAQTFIELAGGQLDVAKILDIKDSCKVQVEPFAISGLITRAQYQKFLDDFWSRPDWELADSAGVRRLERIRAVTTDLGDGGREPATMVTWNQAVAFCQWLTHRQDHGKMIYRLPRLSEWLVAFETGHIGYSQLGCWLANAKDESHWDCALIDYTYSTDENADSGLKRKMVAYSDSAKHPEHGNYYEFIPYPNVGFRVVSESLKKQ